ncbi:MAG: glycerol-3-phosphate acyltransferase [Firmicutes bacterium]|nr:glycerol-3-phosphate acyltransferase [Bacillota bacterium]
MAVVPYLYAIGAVALAYLLGSIPFSFLLGKLWGKDPGEVGRGNIGAANTFRNISPLAGLMSLFLDAGKGYLSVYIAGAAVPGVTVPLLAALAVVTGHNWMLFLKLRGGKGMATSAGALLALSPWGVPAVLAVMIILVFLLRDTNAAGALGMPALPFYLYFAFNSWTAFLIGALWAVVVMVKCRSDISAYRAGRRRLL